MLHGFCSDHIEISGFEHLNGCAAVVTNYHVISKYVLDKTGGQVWQLCI